jgi:hypothetical protein
MTDAFTVSQQGSERHLGSPLRPLRRWTKQFLPLSAVGVLDDP